MEDRVMALLDEDTDTEALATKLLGGAVVAAVVVVVAISMSPVGGGATYTEFYVLNANGTASGYSENVVVGEPTSLRIGIGNFENQQMTYTLYVRDNRTDYLTRRVTVAAEERLEQNVSLTFDSPGRHQVRLELYTDQSTNGTPYRSLRLVIDVAPNESDDGSNTS